MQICCDICGGPLVMLAGGKGAACKNCGMEHSVERVREMLNMGQPEDPPVQVAPPVPPEEKAVKKTAVRVTKKAKEVAPVQESTAAEDVIYDVEEFEAVETLLTESCAADFVWKKGFLGNKLVGYTGNAQRLVLPPEVDEIPAPHFFAGHDELVEVIFPHGLSAPYEAAFANCRNLKRVIIMDSVCAMNDTFAGCTSLEEVQIKDLGDFGADAAPLALGERTFADCVSLKSFSVAEEGKLELAEGCFENCSSLQVFRGTRQTGDYSDDFSIPRSCFKNCTSLKEVYIAEDVTSIEEDAFAGCVNLQRVVRYDGSPLQGVKIHPNAFAGAGWKP